MTDDTGPITPAEPLTGPVSGPGVEPARPVVPYAPGQPPPAYAPAQATYGYASTAMTRPAVGGLHIVIAWIFAVLSFGYFLPWAIAATRQKSNTLAIGLLNFLVGWTVIGWIAAAVMACASEATHVSSVSFAVMPQPQPMQARPSTPAPGWYPQASGQRYWDGQRWTEHTAP